MDEDTQLDGHERCYVRDPFGNRIELIEELDVMQLPFKQTDRRGHVPTRARDGDAGLDLGRPSDHVIEPGERATIAHRARGGDPGGIMRGWCCRAPGLRRSRGSR